MVSFENDYNVGAHPKVLEALIRTNSERLTGYGCDEYCKSAASKILKFFRCPEGEVFFLVGGTQTNQVVISSMLTSCQAVVAADSGHIAVHEAGAIEYSGHKVIPIKGVDGKLAAADLDDYVSRFWADDNCEHMAQPGMIYISQPTELGTLYSKAELTALRQVCDKHKLILYIDGARLASALAAPDNDIRPGDLAALADVFYAGGTKCGALIGEAVVFTHHNMPPHFVPLVKQRGALLAKGRALGVQFDALFTDDLYMEIGAHIMKQAQRLKTILQNTRKGICALSPTNQQFLTMTDEDAAELKKTVTWSFWEKPDDKHLTVRFVTSWATTDEDLDTLEAALK